MKERIKKLINSTVREDILIGFSLLCSNYDPIEFIKTEFRCEGLGDTIRVGVRRSVYMYDMPSFTYKVHDKLYLCVNGYWSVWECNWNPTFIEDHYYHN